VSLNTVKCEHGVWACLLGIWNWYLLVSHLITELMKCLQLNQCSFAILLQSMCHGRNVVQSLVINDFDMCYSVHFCSLNNFIANKCTSFILFSYIT
jgi:hypothetical protein